GSSSAPACISACKPSHTGCVAIIGGPLGKGRAIGASTPFVEFKTLNATTGTPDAGDGAIVPELKHVLALIYEAAGYAAGREIETLIGIEQAPAFMRALLG